MRDLVPLSDERHQPFGQFFLVGEIGDPQAFPPTFRTSRLRYL
jgi:hypothetical protein